MPPDQMSVDEIAAKLKALRNNVAKPLEDARWRYFDPRDFQDLFERYASLRDRLRDDSPKFFSDLPIRDAQPSKTTDFEGRGYFTRSQMEVLLRDIDYCIGVLEGLQTVNLPSMKATREGAFFAGQYYDAYKAIQGIMASARQTITIVDGFFSEEVLSRLTDKAPKVQIKVLTKNAPPNLVTAGQAFNKQYGGLSIRTSQAFHDRFVVVDDTDLYHIGASLKDAGSRGFMFSRVEEPEVVDLLRKKIAEEWNKAQQAL